jgi:hypothetical protein
MAPRKAFQKRWHPVKLFKRDTSKMTLRVHRRFGFGGDMFGHVWFGDKVCPGRDNRASLGKKLPPGKRNATFSKRTWPLALRA